MPPRHAPRAGADRLDRLRADLRDGAAVFTLEVRSSAAPRAIARVCVVEALPTDGRGLQMSMWRNGRGFRPLGARNGMRAVVYPVSQVARRLVGG